MADLGHSGTTDTAAQIDVATVHDGEDHRGCEGGPAEPEEGGRGLRFAAALFGVGGAVGDVVAMGVAAIAAAVHAQIRSGRNCAAKPENDVQSVQCDVDNGLTVSVQESRREQVQ